MAGGRLRGEGLYGVLFMGILGAAVTDPELKGGTLLGRLWTGVLKGVALGGGLNGGTVRVRPRV